MGTVLEFKLERALLSFFFISDIHWYDNLVYAFQGKNLSSDESTVSFNYKDNCPDPIFIWFLDVASCSKMPKFYSSRRKNLTFYPNMS